MTDIEVICDHAGKRLICARCGHAKKHRPERLLIFKELCTHPGQCASEKEVPVRIQVQCVPLMVIDQDQK